MNHERIDNGEHTTLRIRGELDALSASGLRPLLDQIVQEQRRQVTVDLSELRLVDSSGIGALVSLYKRVRGTGGQVEFVGVTAQPRVIFKLLRLDVVFDLEPEPETSGAAAEATAETAPASIRVVRS